MSLYIRTELITSQLVELSAGEILKIKVVAGDKTATCNCFISSTVNEGRGYCPQTRKGLKRSQVEKETYDYGRFLILT